LIPATKLVLEDGVELTALPTDRPAWARLCRLLTLGKRRAEKGGCILRPGDVTTHAEGMILLLHPETLGRNALKYNANDRRREIRTWTAALPGQVHIAAAPSYDGRDSERFDRLAKLAAETGAPMVATAAPMMHKGARRRLADVLTCIREGLTIDRIGKAAQANAERRLRSEPEMRRLFKSHGEVIDKAQEISDRCTFSLDELRYEYPDEVSNGEDPQIRLKRLTKEGLKQRYPDGVPPRVRDMAEHELRLIAKLDYARYFLTVCDIVEFAESRGILPGLSREFRCLLCT
jgi:DNA polymerase III alpha subunit